MQVTRLIRSKREARKKNSIDIFVDILDRYSTGNHMKKTDGQKKNAREGDMIAHVYNVAAAIGFQTKIIN